jgi:hypothetical protein
MSRWPIVLLAMLAAFWVPPIPVSAQEARAGFDMRATLTAEAVVSNQLTGKSRSGDPMIVGARSVAYPTWKINEHWFATGALQMATHPYYYSDLSTPGYGAKGEVLQATLNYARVTRKASILVRAGEMSTAFGSFVLRYDDADNPLVDLPIAYSYYYSPVSVGGIFGAQIDATCRKWDARAQFANSSPANPRSILAHDQYGNYAAGFGYTIRQGFRVGVSGYRGPYLSRDYDYFFRGEANPSKLPARALGVDANWAHGHTSVQAELQKFVLPYTVVPTFREKAGYAEFKQVLSPRWYVAGRHGWSRVRVSSATQVIETAIGFRPDRFQLIKVGYEIEHNGTGTKQNDNRLGIQLITTFHKSFDRQ